MKVTNEGNVYVSEHHYGDKIYTLKIKCKYVDFEDKYQNQKLKNLEITLIEPKGRVWVGLDNVGENQDNIPTTTIKRANRHGHSYRGGGTYGEFGGYDIALLELDDQIGGQFACLPSPLFKDNGVNAQVAGYGTYIRDQCETNQFGFSKHHYCELNSKCESEKPPPQSKNCSNFFSRVIEWSEDGKYDEVMLRLGKDFIFCHSTENPENSVYGWCSTGKKNYYRVRTRLMNKHGWGYCSKDCFLDRKSVEGQALRHVDNVHVGYKVFKWHLKFL